MNNDTNRLTAIAQSGEQTEIKDFDIAGSDVRVNEATESYNLEPSEKNREMLEYARLDGIARRMLQRPDLYSDAEFDATFKELHTRRFLDNPRLMTAFDRPGDEHAGQGRLSDFIDFTDSLSKMSTAKEQMEAIGTKYSASLPEYDAWMKAQQEADGGVAFARKYLDEKGRKWGDKARSLLGMLNINEWLDRAIKPKKYKDENFAPQWLSDWDAKKEVESRFTNEKLLMGAAQMMPFLTKEQRNLVNLVAHGADPAEFSGILRAMKKEDRNLMRSMIQAVRPEYKDLAWIPDEGLVRAASSISQSARGFGRAAKMLGYRALYTGAITGDWYNPLSWRLHNLAPGAKEEMERMRADFLEDIRDYEALSKTKFSDPEGFISKATAGFFDSSPIQFSMIGGELAKRGGAEMVKSGQKWGYALQGAGYLMQGYTAASMIGEHFDNMLLNGIHPDKAVALSFAGGLASTWIERWNLNSYLGLNLSSAEMKRIGVRAAFRAGLKMNGKELAKIARTNAKQALVITSTELGEEVAQALEQEGMVEVGRGKDIISAFTGDTATQKAFDALVEALPTCSAFGFMGTLDLTGSTRNTSLASYRDNLDVVSRAIAEREGKDALDLEVRSSSAAHARNMADRVAVATAGMSNKERAAWLNAQEDMTDAERAFYTEHCALKEAISAQDGSTYANAILSGSINEALFEKEGWKFDHDESGKIIGITSKDGDTIPINIHDRKATIEEFDDQAVAMFIEEWNEMNPDKSFNANALTDENERKRLESTMSEYINGLFNPDGGISLYLGDNVTRENAEHTLAHEIIHKLLDDIEKSTTREARKTVRSLKLALGKFYNEQSAIEGEVAARGIAAANRENATPDTIDWSAVAHNVGEAFKRIGTLGIKRGEWAKAFKTTETLGIDPKAILGRIIGSAILTAKEQRENEEAERAKLNAERKTRNAEREEKRQKKIEMRKAEFQKREREQWNNAEQRAEEERKFWSELRQKEEAERREAQAQAIAKAQEEERKRKDYERNRKDSPFPRLIPAPHVAQANTDSAAESSQRGFRAYETLWKVAKSKKLSKSDIAFLGEEYGLPAEVLTKPDKFSAETLGKFNDALSRLWADVKSVRIAVPPVYVATEADKLRVLPNEVYDPVFDRFVDGEIIVDPSKALPFADESAAGMRFSIQPNVEQAQREYDDVVSRFTNPDGTKKPGWRKAPNGKPSNLTERQWVQVRTPSFKKWFGDWEAAAEINPFDLNTAKEKIQDLIHHQEEVLTADGVKLLFRGQAKKAWSKEAERESDNSAAHWAAVGNIDNLCRRAVQLWEEKPRNGSTDIRAYVKYGAVFTFGGERYIAKITTKAYPEQESQNFYSVESVAVEKIIAHGIHKTITKGQSLDVSDENKISNLIDSVNSASKVVDENGEPLVVAHSTNAVFTIFRDMQKTDAGWLGAGFYFFGDRSLDGQYGRNVMECFLNIRNPYMLSDYEHNELVEVDDAERSREFADELRNEGYDGVYYNGDLDQEHAVFSPTQIKSATDNTGAFDGTNADIRFSIAAIEEAAINWGAITDANGKPIVLYHGDSSKEKRYYLKDDIALFTTPSKKTADAFTYGNGTLYAYYGRMKKPLVIDANMRNWDNIPVPNEILENFLEGTRSPEGETISGVSNDLADAARDAGYDGLIIKNVLEGGGEVVDDYVFLRPDGNIKSAEEITYDYYGNRIPLEERFSASGDTRFSVAAESPLYVRDIEGEHEVLRIEDVMKGRSEKELREFLRKNPEAYVRLYHGTGAQLEGGLKRTSAKTRRTSAVTRGYVYLSANPATARRFGEFGYDGNASVWAADVKVKELKPDGDSIFLSRQNGKDIERDDLAASLFHTGNARVKRDIAPWEISPTRFSIGGIFTGSAADYEKPSLHYVGTGEGNQVYGWGLYGSTVRGVAERYARANRDYMREITFRGKTAEQYEQRSAENLALNWVRRYGSPENAVREVIETWEGELPPNVAKAADILRNHKSEFGIKKPKPGNIYEQTFFTDRAPGDESHLLKWYEPVSEWQKNLLEDALSKNGVTVRRVTTGPDYDRGTYYEKDGKLLVMLRDQDAKLTGELAYQLLSKDEVLGSPKAASEWLAAHDIDGVKYPVDSYGGKTVKDGEKVGWNYVSFRDDNIRVDHKWTDGKQRFSIRTRAYNPEAKVAVVDGRNEPAFLNLTTAEIRQYLRDKYMDREVVIDSDGTPVLFTGKGLNSALKKRDKHKRVLHVLDNLVKNSHYTRFEPNDGQDKHSHLLGQFVYTAAIRLSDGVYGVELKLDIPKSDPEGTHFKGQTVKTKIADAVLSVRRADGVERTSTDEASAEETVRLGEIVSTPQIIPYSPAERNTQRLSIGRPDSRRALKHYLAREIVETDSLPSSRSIANTARNLGVDRYEIPQIIAEAQASAAEDIKMLRYIASNPKIEKLVVSAGLTDYYEKAIKRARKTAIKYSRDVSELKEKSSKALERTVRTVRGEEYDEMLRRDGIDINAVLLAIRPDERKQPSQVSSSGEESGAAVNSMPTPQSEAKGRDAAQSAIARAKELVEAAKVAVATAPDTSTTGKKAQNATPSGDKGDTAAYDNKGATDTDPMASEISKAYYRAIAESGITLDNPAAVVQLIKAQTERYILDNPTKVSDLDRDNVFASPIARAIFAGNVASFAQAVAAAYAPSYARIRIGKKAQLLNDHTVNSSAAIERVATEIFEDLHRDIIRQSRNSLISEIKKLLKKGADGYSERAERQDRKISADAQSWCKASLWAINVAPSKVEEESAKLQSTLQSYGSSKSEAENSRYRDFAEAQLKLSLLTSFGKIRERMPAELAELRDKVGQMVDEGVFDAMTFSEKWEATRNAVVEDALPAIVGNPKDEGREPEKTSWLYSLVGMMEPKWRQLTRFCRDDEVRKRSIKAMGTVETMIQSAYDKEANYRTEQRKKLKDLLVSVYGSEYNARKALNADIDEKLWAELDRGEQHTKWTVGRLLQMYVSCVQSDYADNCEKYNRGADYAAKLEEIINALDPRHFDLIRGLREFYLAQGDDLSEVYIRSAGVPLWTPNRNYMPVSIQNPHNLGKNVEVRTYNPYATSLTPRVKHGLDFDQKADIIETCFERIDDAAHTIGWADTGSLVIGICQSDRILNAIRKAHGSAAMGQWNRYILDVVAPKAELNTMEAKFAKALMRFASRLWLGLNIKSWAKQIASVPCYALSACGKISDVAASLSFWALHPAEGIKVARDLAETRAFQARYGLALSQELKYATSSDGALKTWWQATMDKAMSGVYAFDKLGAYLLAGIYRRRRIALEQDGMSAAEASEVAASWLMHIVDKTAQSGRTVNTTELQRAGGAWAFVLQFKSASTQQTQFEIVAVQDALANPSDAKRWKKAAAVIAINHFIVPAIMTSIDALMLMLTGWGIPDEEKRKRLAAIFAANVLSGSLGSLAFLGTVIEGVARGSMDWAIADKKPSARTVGNQPVPMFSVVEHFWNSGNKAMKAFEELQYGDIEDGVINMVEAIGGVIPGISSPVRTATKTIRAIKEK